MGTDIHLLFERRNFFDQPKDIWQKIEIDESLMPDDRNYPLFAFLADGRRLDGYPPAQFPRRGIPADCSEKDPNTNDFWLGDWGYTHAYLDEILKADWKLYDLHDCYFIIFCEHILPRLITPVGRLSNEQERNVRVVMGFDN